MKVIKTVALLLAAMLILFSLNGCKKEKALTVTEISERLSEMCLQNAETYEVSKGDIENRFNFDGNLLDECSVRLCDTEEKYLCVAVFTLKDKANKQIVIDGISSTMKSTAASFGVLYNSEYNKIQHRLFYEYSDILVFVVADDYKASEDYLKTIGASPIA
jgi:hypothetical protein